MPNFTRKTLVNLSSRANTFCGLRVWHLLLASSFVFATNVSAQNSPKRPKITGIASVHFISTNLPQARAFYAKILDESVACFLCEEREAKSFTVHFSSGQFATFYPAPKVLPNNLLTAIFFSTDDVKGMKRYLKASKVKLLDPKNSDQSLHVKDPEGHDVWFIQQGKPHQNANGLASRIIHAGFIVKNRETEDKFYKELLGFRPYWHGGMKEDETTWVSQQVPEGTDWIEFMLYDDSKADKHFRGVMNHFAVGVVSVQTEAELLTQKGWNLTEEPKIGRDGKWQLNVYDPDETRVEFMEFTPVQKPCCSDFTAPHPKP